MKALVVIGIVLFVLALIVAVAALGGLIIMFLGNIILEYFDQKPLTYEVAFAISAVLWFVGGLFQSSGSK